MAQDWIAIDKRLARKPEFLGLLGATAESTAAVAWRLFEFWSWVDDHVPASGRIEKVGLVGLDALFGGGEVFWRAMIEVGWLRDDGVTLTVPEWKKRFGKGAKARKLSAQRSKNYREKKKAQKPGDASRTVTRDASRPHHANHATRGDYRREEEITEEETTKEESKRASSVTSAGPPAAGAASDASDGGADVTLTSAALKLVRGKTIDWTLIVPDVANQVLKNLEAKLGGTGDRELVLKVAALRQLGVISENEFWDSCEAVRAQFASDDPPKGTRFGYWHGVLTQMLEDRRVLFNALLKNIKGIPEELRNPPRKVPQTQPAA